MLCIIFFFLKILELYLIILIKANLVVVFDVTVILMRLLCDFVNR